MEIWEKPNSMFKFRISAESSFTYSQQFKCLDESERNQYKHRLSNVYLLQICFLVNTTVIISSDKSRDPPQIYLTKRLGNIFGKKLS